VRHRYLHPTIRRWLSRDPLEYVGSLNLYIYVANKPTNSIDFNGLLDASECTYGELRECAYLIPAPFPPPPNLGDVKASLGAACNANPNKDCNCITGKNAKVEPNKSAWRNIEMAEGNDLSKGAQFICINRDDCWWVWSCCACLNPGAKNKKDLKYCFVRRRKRLTPVVTLE
jgi:hypothetical protein